MYAVDMDQRDLAAERLRAEAEAVRQQQERDRQARERQRVAAEGERVAAEDVRVTATVEVRETVATMKTLLGRMEAVEKLRRSRRQS